MWGENCNFYYFSLDKREALNTTSEYLRFSKLCPKVKMIKLNHKSQKGEVGQGVRSKGSNRVANI